MFLSKTNSQWPEVAAVKQLFYLTPVVFHFGATLYLSLIMGVCRKLQLGISQKRQGQILLKFACGRDVVTSNYRDLEVKILWRIFQKSQKYRLAGYLAPYQTRQVFLRWLVTILQITLEFDTSAWLINLWWLYICLHPSPYAINRKQFLCRCSFWKMWKQ